MFVSQRDEIRGARFAQRLANAARESFDKQAAHGASMKRDGSSVNAGYNFEFDRSGRAGEAFGDRKYVHSIVPRGHGAR
jgi:hypothetical protein